MNLRSFLFVTFLFLSGSILAAPETGVQIVGCEALPSYPKSSKLSSIANAKDVEPIKICHYRALCYVIKDGDPTLQTLQLSCLANTSDSACPGPTTCAGRKDFENEDREKMEPEELSAEAREVLERYTVHERIVTKDEAAQLSSR